MTILNRLQRDAVAGTAGATTALADHFELLASVLGNKEKTPRLFESLAAEFPAVTPAAKRLRDAITPFLAVVESDLH